MQVFTTSKARQNFANVLKTVTNDGKVLIKRKDGKSFLLTEYKNEKKNPFDVEGINISLSKTDIVECVREGRER
jgi:hypothetical protein